MSLKLALGTDLPTLLYMIFDTVRVLAKNVLYYSYAVLAVFMVLLAVFTRQMAGKKGNFDSDIYFCANLEYNISMKGMNKMKRFEQLDQLVEKNDGTVQTSQVLEAGISKPVFYAYTKEKGLQQAAHGVYVAPDAWTDAFYLLHLPCGQAIFSHETALFFHNLTDREPFRYSITVKTGYNPSRLQEDNIQVYTV